MANLGSIAAKLWQSLFPCWTVTGDSTANAAKTITKAAVTGSRHYITGYLVSVTGAAVGTADIAIELQDDTTTVWKDVLGAAAARGQRAGVVFAHPIELTVSKAANLVVAAGGASVITFCNMTGFTY